MDKDFSDMMSKFSDMMGSLGNNTNQAHTQTQSQNNSFNFDINTFIKLKSVMDKMNSSPDPRSNLLRSLKPYLRENKQAKVDQYINLFSMSKIMETLRQTGGENK